MEQSKLTQEKINAFLKEWAEKMIEIRETRVQPIWVAHLDTPRLFPIFPMEDHETVIHASRPFVEMYQGFFGMRMQPHSLIVEPPRDRALSIADLSDFIEAAKVDLLKIPHRNIFKKKRARWRIKPSKKYGFSNNNKQRQ